MSRRKIVLFFAALMALALIVTACNKTGASNTTTTANTTATTKNTSAADTSTSSPTATAKTFYEATKAKDVDGMKKTLSKKSLEVLEAFAKMGNKSLDESLKESDSTKQAPTFEAQNEKITGDTATLDVKDENGKWQSLPFVKEDGQWKIALDQVLEKAFSQMGSEKSGNEGEQKKGGSEGEQPTP